VQTSVAPHHHIGERQAQAAASQVHPAAFFGLTYLLSWLIWVPLALSHLGIGPLHIPEEISSGVRLLGVLMPATSALLLAAWAGGRSAVRGLLGRLTVWRVGWVWWAAAVVVQPALLVAVGLLYSAFGGQPPVTALPPVPAAALAVNVVMLALATLGEEVGWRGVALPALQRRYGARAASAILGLLWATWHLPFWLLLDTFDQFGVGYLALNYLLILPSTLYITWFFNHSRSSLLLPVAFHVAFNIVNVAWLPVTTNVRAFGLFIALEWIVALLVSPHLEARQANATLANRDPLIREV
jgi:membrane protease YdiL (CAAX protease family)